MKNMFYAERKMRIKEEVPLSKRRVYVTTQGLSYNGVCLPTEMRVPKTMADFHGIIRKNSKGPYRLRNEFLESDDKLLLVMEEDRRLAGVDQFGSVSLQFPRPYQYGGSGSWGGRVELGIGVKTPTLRRNDLRAKLGSLNYWGGKPVFDFNEVVRKEGFPITIIGLGFKRYFKRGKDKRPEAEDLDFEWAFESGRLIGNMYRFSIDGSSVEEPHAVKEREPVFVKDENGEDGFFGCYAINGKTGVVERYQEIVGGLTQKASAKEFLEGLCKDRERGLKGLMEILIGRVVPDIIEQVRFI